MTHRCCQHLPFQPWITAALIFIRMIVKTNKIKPLQASSQMRLLPGQMQMIILNKVINVCRMKTSQINGQPKRTRITLACPIKTTRVLCKEQALLFRCIVSDADHFARRKTLKQRVKSQTTIDRFNRTLSEHFRSTKKDGIRQLTRLMQSQNKSDG